MEIILNILDKNQTSTKVGGGKKDLISTLNSNVNRSSSKIEKLDASIQKLDIKVENNKYQVLIRKKIVEQQKYSVECIKVAKIKNKMETSISLEQCIDRFESVTGLMGNRKEDGSINYEIWDYFKEIYNEIPQAHKLKILTLKIYTNYPFREAEFFEYLNEIIDGETEEQFKLRVKENKRALKKYLDKDGFITLYRGITEDSLSDEFALSYTINKTVVERFSKRFNKSGQEVVVEEFHINQVIAYTNDREEQEVIIIPGWLDEY
ncbi:hypothetical protein [Clostridium sp.]|uniref:hypothetical protein n=1 Tax=Clostridium sp. TaxID=1506 RepID=UPI003D6CFD94